ncbi:30S ribosomal protein S20 [Dissostichus eleginoides]|uniref:30S ribosomal protein S20 n=1 Tax=Dissostichus eleginoides TaxID=100907 RepID=A0AAD9FKQ1_DISEL|nr:30S ribosomal protein S20 [Dissostichus eleginoides]
MLLSQGQTGLCVYLNEDEKLVKEYMSIDNSSETAMAETVFGIFVIRHEGAEPGDDPENVGIILEGVEVLDELGNKICAHCLKEQPKKQRLEKKLKRFDEKREDWVSGRKKNHNIASIKDEAIVLLEKLHAIGF